MERCIAVDNPELLMNHKDTKAQRIDETGVMRKIALIVSSRNTGRERPWRKIL